MKYLRFVLASLLFTCLLMFAQIPDVVINEIYYDTDLSGDSTAFTELFGPAGASLDSFYLYGINGANGNPYGITPLSGYIIPPDSFFVIARDSGTANFDLVNYLSNWRNGSDNVLLVHVANNDTTIVDAVGYGSYDTTGWVFTGEGMPAPDAYNKSIYRYPDGDDTDNNTIDFLAYYATPGIANYGPPKVLSIAGIQGMSSSTPYLDSLVEVIGIITASEANKVFIQDASGQWNGVFIHDIYSELPMNQGDSVKFACVPDEFFDFTRLLNPSKFENFGPASAIPAPFLTTPGDIDGDEANEGVLVELNLITVVDPDIGSGEWIVSDGADGCVIDDYYSYTPPDSGDIISILRGPVVDSVGNYKIEPRGDFDILSFDETVDSALLPINVWVDYPFTPYCWVRSALDTPEDSFFVFFEVDSTGAGDILYRDSVYTWIDAGNSVYIEFNEVVPPEEDSVIIRYFTSLDLDVNTSNDTLEQPLLIEELTAVISEIYYDSPGTDDSLFTELHGPAGASLDNCIIYGVNGNGGAIYRVIDLTGYTIPSDSFFVIASDPIPEADLVANVDWQNGPDNVVLAYISGPDTMTVDAVGYGSYDTTGWVFVGEGMPAPDVYPGHSLYRTSLDSDNNLQDFVGSGIFTPGATNFGPPTLTTISDIQGVDTITPYLDSLVELVGVITASDGYNIFMQDAYGPWNGIVIEMQDYPISMGDSLLFVCSPIEYYEETRLVDRSMIQNFGPATMVPAPYLTTPGDIDTNEANEGVLVELNLITVVDPDIGNGEWLVSDGADTCVINDYYSYTPPDSGDIISILRGPVAYTYGDYKIEPRGNFDILSFDAMVNFGFKPDTINSIDGFTPYAFIISNLDAPEDSFYTYFEVDSGANTIHRDSVYDWLSSGSKKIDFSNWAPGFDGAFTIRYYTALDLDVNPTNDIKEYLIYASGVEKVDDMPKVFALTVPNISVGMGSVDYAVPEKAPISISLFDKLGRRVSTLVGKIQNPGYYQIKLERLDLPSGVYFIKMESTSFESIKKMIILK